MKTKTSDTDVNEYFRRKGFRVRLRDCLLGPYWNILIETMRGWAYSRHVIYTTIEHGLRFAEFAAHMSATTPMNLTDELVDTYHERQQHPRMLKESRRCLRLLMHVLREHGVIPAVANVPVPRPAILHDYLQFLAEHRGTSTDRIERHRVHIEAFLQSLGKPDLCSVIDSQAVSRFITTRAPALGRAERKTMCAALRTFLRSLCANVTETPFPF